MPVGSSCPSFSTTSLTSTMSLVNSDPVLAPKRRIASGALRMYQSPLSEEARERLRAMTDTTDGFEIAERDLRLRGPGDFFGTRQAGLPTFRLIDLVRDRDLLDLAQREAAAWFETAAPTQAVVAKLVESWESRFKLIEVG